MDDPLRGEFAKSLVSTPHWLRSRGHESAPSEIGEKLEPTHGGCYGEENFSVRRIPVKYRQWGEGLEHEAVMQMEKACLLPVSVAGAGRAMSRKAANEKFN